MRGLYWLRSDIRLQHNKTLEQFKAECKSGIILWCPTKSYSRAAHFRKSFVDDCLYHFSQSLEPYQQSVIIESKGIGHILKDYIHKYKIEKVFYTSECATEEIGEEQEVKKICKDNSVLMESFDQNTLRTEKNLPFSLSDMPFVFTNFRKKVEADLKVNSLVQSSDQFPEALVKEKNKLCANKSLLFHGGENAATERLKHYLQGSNAIQTYKETRNGLLDFDDSSKFSPWLSTGCLSPLLVYHEIKKYEDEVCSNDSTYWLVFELLWRDYFKFFSKKYGAKIFQEKGVTSQPSEPIRKMCPIQIKFFNQWCDGQTHDDFVNANMLELQKTGWMSNRGRQNVASYLIHDLNVNWTMGASYFEKMLIDYDPDSNWGNWLYLSGKGSDPRSRKFNTQKQANDYDPSGNYRRKWLT